MSDAVRPLSNADDPDTPEDPIAWHDVLLDECRALNPSFGSESSASAPDLGLGAGATPGARLHALNRAALAQGHSALCLSGGGIRSASFAVGVMQGLARHGLLDRFDYLSTVSGGGFAGAWFSAWRYRAAPPAVPDPVRIAEAAAAHDAMEQLTRGGGQPGHVEPWPLTRLRRYTRYMSPDTGMFSADFWGLITTMLRNLLLNWLVLLPLLAAAMLVPRFQFSLIHLIEQDVQSPSSLWLVAQPATLAFANVAYLVALAYIVADLPSYGNRRGSQAQFLIRCLLPLCIGTLAFTYSWVMGQVHIPLGRFVGIAAGSHAIVWVVVGLLTGNRPFRPRTWGAALAAGAFGALVFNVIVRGLFDNGELSKMYVTTAFPLVLGSLLLQAVVFVGLAGREITAADLEWWSRTGAWILIVALSWLLACVLVFGGPVLVGRLMVWSPHALKGLSGMTALLGGITSWLARPSPERGRPSPIRNAAMALAAPAFVVLVIVALATLNEQALRRMAMAGDQDRFAVAIQSWVICRPEQEREPARNRCHPADGGLGETVGLFALVLGFGLAMSRCVPANKFSLHSMYHHRVTRAFLGASRLERQPNPFTGFDQKDDIEFARLAGQRPLHIVNATLNTRVDSHLGRTERRALSFTFSPLHVGNSGLGYRPAAGFAYNPLQRQGVSLGTAVTISGAAASPAMGEFTKPALAFLLTLLNARLGVWVGNPGTSGSSTWRRTDPTAGIGPIVREMLGLTTDVNPYVYLSDGGHFDNLGLWEMVHRRCKFIVVADAGCDPEYTFADLANALRQVRIDQGVTIDLAPVTMGGAGQGARQPHVLVGTIRYDDVGGVGALIYIKPALTGDEAVDVLNYQKSHPAFPHESTAEQWFSEAQFESYRVLGLHSIEVALADRSENGLGTVAEKITAAGLPRVAAASV
jgi:hypothetical protein